MCENKLQVLRLDVFKQVINPKRRASLNVKIPLVVTIIIWSCFSKSAGYVSIILTFPLIPKCQTTLNPLSKSKTAYLAIRYTFNIAAPSSVSSKSAGTGMRNFLLRTITFWITAPSTAFLRASLIVSTSGSSGIANPFICIYFKNNR